MDSCYLKLISGSRLTNYMGLSMSEGHEFRNGINYLYLEIPFLKASGSENETEIKRNQHVNVVAACKLNVKGYNIVHIEPNPALAEFGQVQASYNVHPNSGEMMPNFWFTARKDVNLSTDINYAVRLYMWA